MNRPAKAGLFVGCMRKAVFTIEARLPAQQS
jgi:hypothetical protein